MENQSGLRPLGRAVLIKQYEPERKGAAIIVPDTVQDRMASLDVRAIVIEVGPACWPDEPTPRARAGDKVFVARLSGFAARGPLDGQAYRLVNDRDIFAAIVKEAS